MKKKTAKLFCSAVLQRAALQDFYPCGLHINVLIQTARKLRQVPSEYQNEIDKQEGILSGLSVKKENIEELLKSGLDRLSQLRELYVNGTIEEKRRIIGSMYPEKLVFDGYQLRTTRVNEVISLIAAMDTALKGNKKGTNNDFSCLSQRVIRIGLEPMTLSLEG